MSFDVRNGYAVVPVCGRKRKHGQVDFCGSVSQMFIPTPTSSVVPSPRFPDHLESQTLPTEQNSDNDRPRKTGQDSRVPTGEQSEEKTFAGTATSLHSRKTPLATIHPCPSSIDLCSVTRPQSIGDDVIFKLINDSSTVGVENGTTRTSSIDQVLEAERVSEKAQTAEDSVERILEDKVGRMVSEIQSHKIFTQLGTSIYWWINSQKHKPPHVPHFKDIRELWQYIIGPTFETISFSWLFGVVHRRMMLLEFARRYRRILDCRTPLDANDGDIHIRAAWLATRQRSSPPERPFSHPPKDYRGLGMTARLRETITDESGRSLVSKKYNSLRQEAAAYLRLTDHFGSQILTFIPIIGLQHFRLPLSFWQIVMDRLDLEYPQLQHHAGRFFQNYETIIGNTRPPKLDVPKPCSAVKRKSFLSQEEDELSPPTSGDLLDRLDRQCLTLPPLPVSFNGDLPAMGTARYSITTY